MKTILVTTSSFATNSSRPLEILQKGGYQVVDNPFGRKLTEEELRALLDEHGPIGLLAGTEPITRSILEGAKGHLKIISRVGVGCDNVDREAAKKLGIHVLRTEGVLSQAVAELTLGMILSALRGIPFQTRQLRSGVWQKGTGRLLQGKAVGIIGFGSIGQRVGELVKAFGANVIYHDPEPKDLPWAKRTPLEELLATADIITLHASGSHQIIGEVELNSLCKSGVILVNTARGGLVDEEALCEALMSGKVSCACMDVFDQEPYTGDLKRLDNVILTPHIGSYALEARIRMEEMAVENLLEGLSGHTRGDTGDERS